MRRSERRKIKRLKYDPQEERDVKPKIKFEPKTEKQQLYYDNLLSYPLSIALGPAGSGKTFVSAAASLQLLYDGEVDKIIITKPMVETSGTSSMGYLPGDVDKKTGPYIRSVYDCYEKLIGKVKLSQLKADGKIEIIPLEYMRGLTFDTSFILLDEAQNANYLQLKTLLTRIGEGSHCVISGDESQCDLGKTPDLTKVISLLKGIKNEYVSFIEFDLSDIVRSPMTQKICEAFANYEKNK